MDEDTRIGCRQVPKHLTQQDEEKKKRHGDTATNNFNRYVYEHVWVHVVLKRTLKDIIC